MPTLNTILKELKNVPVDRLGDLYSIIHALQVNTQNAGKKAGNILSFAGSFSDMDESEYQDLVKITKETRNELFDRKFKI